MSPEHAIEDVDLRKTEHDPRERRPDIPSIDISIYKEADDMVPATEQDEPIYFRDTDGSIAYR